MSANQEQYRSTVAAAGVTQTNALAAAEAAKQSTLAAVTSNVGYIPGTSGAGAATYLSSVLTANAAKADAIVAAERAKQASQNAARDTLRATGEAWL